MIGNDLYWKRPAHKNAISKIAFWKLHFYLQVSFEPHFGSIPEIWSLFIRIDQGIDPACPGFYMYIQNMTVFLYCCIFFVPNMTFSEWILSKNGLFSKFTKDRGAFEFVAAVWVCWSYVTAFGLVQNFPLLKRIHFNYSRSIGQKMRHNKHASSRRKIRNNSK